MSEGRGCIITDGRFSGTTGILLIGEEFVPYDMNDIDAKRGTFELLQKKEMENENLILDQDYFEILKLFSVFRCISPGKKKKLRIIQNLMKIHKLFMWWGRNRLTKN